MRRDFDALQRAIESDHDIEAADDAWNMCERWLVCIDATAADRIAALQAENERLREALFVIAYAMTSTAIARQQARAALEATKQGVVADD